MAIAQLLPLMPDGDYFAEFLCEGEWKMAGVLACGARHSPRVLIRMRRLPFWSRSAAHAAVRSPPRFPAGQRPLANVVAGRHGTYSTHRHPRLDSLTESPHPAYPQPRSLPHGPVSRSGCLLAWLLGSPHVTDFLRCVRLVVPSVCPPRGGTDVSGRTMPDDDRATRSVVRFQPATARLPPSSAEVVGRFIVR
jgi:hypothetical protein